MPSRSSAVIERKRKGVHYHKNRLYRSDYEEAELSSGVFSQA